ncbi:MAG: hypothetical protein HC831_08200 [Chloroflexia bacterium]|nr:hypothetical protein [Chloroflexia bacterium]
MKKYLHGLSKEQLEEQITDLYARFREVKVFYDFVFNPQEDKLLDECKFRISKEYFPVNGRKAKARRSVAQKYIKHFKQLGADPSMIADIMLYNIEIAQTFSGEKEIKQDAFYKSMLKSFEEAVEFIVENGLQPEFKSRLQSIVDEVNSQGWFNKNFFEKAMINV